MESNCNQKSDVLFGYMSRILYITYSSSDYVIGSFFGNLVKILMLNIIFWIIYCYSINKENIYVKLFFLFVVVSNILQKFPFGNRVILYFSIFQILSFPFFFDSKNMREAPMIRLLLLIYAILIFVMTFGNGGIFPYEFSN